MFAIFSFGARYLSFPKSIPNHFHMFLARILRNIYDDSRQLSGRLCAIFCILPFSAKCAPQKIIHHQSCQKMGPTYFMDGSKMGLWRSTSTKQQQSQLLSGPCRCRRSSSWTVPNTSPQRWVRWANAAAGPTRHCWWPPRAPGA